jgi:hypothetical protein
MLLYYERKQIASIAENITALNRGLTLGDCLNDDGCLSLECSFCAERVSSTDINLKKMERRDFVKLAGIGGASLALASPGKRLWGDDVSVEKRIEKNNIRP